MKQLNCLLLILGFWAIRFRQATAPTRIIISSRAMVALPAVFGTSVPPSGLSGQIRRFAFRFSESEYGHWLPLLVADRVNVVEGIIDDFRQGRVPNILAEKGMSADWKYNRKGLLQQAIIGAVVATAVITFLSRDKRPTKRAY